MVSNPFRAVGTVGERPTRLRRSCLAVPGSSPRKMAKAADIPADQIVIDLEDAVVPDQKASARAKVVEGLHENDYSGKVRVVRVNDATTPHQYRDIIEIVTGAGSLLDCLMLPKVQDAGQVWFAENLLTQLELDVGLERRIGLELQIETGMASAHMAEIAAVTDRTETLVFGPGDYAADLGIPQLDIGAVESGYPGHQWHYIISQIVNTARAIGREAIDGPYSDFADEEGFRESCRRARLLGVDGKWCIHPSQVEAANEEFTPSRKDYDQARRLLDAYAEAVRDGRGAVTLDGKMVDEASRKMAERVAARGRAAGME